jgi:hypothetical protein
VPDDAVSVASQPSRSSSSAPPGDLDRNTRTFQQTRCGLPSWRVDYVWTLLGERGIQR